MRAISADDQPAKSYALLSGGQSPPFELSVRGEIMVELTPAPSRIVTIADNSQHFEVTCPFCKERLKYPHDPCAAIAQIVHRCEDRNVYFMNGYAFTGVKEFLAAESVSRAR